jgi:hypothetical protein
VTNYRFTAGDWSGPVLSFLACTPARRSGDPVISLEEIKTL